MPIVSPDKLKKLRDPEEEGLYGQVEVAQASAKIDEIAEGVGEGLPGEQVTEQVDEVLVGATFAALEKEAVQPSKEAKRAVDEMICVDAVDTIQQKLGMRPPNPTGKNPTAVLETSGNGGKIDKIVEEFADHDVQIMGADGEPHDAAKTLAESVDELAKSMGSEPKEVVFLAAHEQRQQQMAEVIQDPEKLAQRILEMQETVAHYSDEELSEKYRSDSVEIQGLFEDISNTEVNLRDPRNRVMHMRVLRALEKTQGSMLAWRGRKEYTWQIPETLSNYAQKGELANLHFENFQNDLQSKLREIAEQKDLSPEMRTEARRAAVAEFESASRAAVSYNLDLKHDQMGIGSKIASGYFGGDLRTFGLAYVDGVLSPNDQYMLSMRHFLENTGMVGPVETKGINHSLGVINFDRYNKDQIKMAQVFSVNGWIASDEPISMMISGVDGDPKGVYPSAMRDVRTKRMVPAEVSDESDLKQLAERMSACSAPIKRLTLAAHGGKSGIRLSKKLLIGRRNEQDTTTGVAMIRPGMSEGLDNVVRAMKKNNPNPMERQNIILMSCAQGKDFKDERWQRRVSMGHVLAEAYRNTTVTAARDRSYADRGKGSGEIFMSMLNRSSRILEDYRSGKRKLPKLVATLLERRDRQLKNTGKYHIAASSEFKAYLDPKTKKMVVRRTETNGRVKVGA